MRGWFGEVEWRMEFEDLNINEMWNKFASIVDIAIKKFVPLVCNQT